MGHQAHVEAAAHQIRDHLDYYLRWTNAEWTSFLLSEYYSDFQHRITMVESARLGDRFARNLVDDLICDHLRAKPRDELPEPLRSYALWKLTGELLPERRGPSFFAYWPRKILVRLAVGIGMDNGLQRTRTRNKHGGPALSACALASRELTSFRIRLKETTIERMTDHLESRSPEWAEFVEVCARIKPHPPVLCDRTRSKS
jgi:hypothetical protein